MDGVALNGFVDKARYGLQAAAQAEPGHTTDPAKAKQAAQDFESFFLTMVFENMFAGIKTDGYFGGGHGESRSEEHTSELQSLMRNSYAVFCLKKKKETSINL